MAPVYSFSEQVDMLLVLGLCQHNYSKSVQVYREKFPNRQTPDRRTFASIERRLRETGMLSVHRPNAGRTSNVRRLREEQQVLDIVSENPNISTRLLEHQIGVPKTAVNRILKQQLLHPYHLQPVQELLPGDHDARLLFARIMRQKRRLDPNFHKRVLFTDEACFTRRGVTNFHNEHHYADENPHAIHVRHFQREFKINVWIGIIDDHLIGPVRLLPNKLTAETYLHFLQETLPELLEDLPIALRRDMWYMHDGAPPHFGRIVRDYLNEQFPNKWIGRGHDAPVPWPARSPDLNPCDFSLWGQIKTYVYKEEINTQEQLWDRIENAVASLRNRENLERISFNFLRRLEALRRVNGSHIEQLVS